jgi:hypothetical protein
MDRCETACVGVIESLVLLCVGLRHLVGCVGSSGMAKSTSCVFMFDSRD